MQFQTDKTSLASIQADLRMFIRHVEPHRHRQISY